jgi:hypothetical protein
MQSNPAYPNFMHVTENEVPYEKCGSPLQYQTCPCMQTACLSEPVSLVAYNLEKQWYSMRHI